MAANDMDHRMQAAWLRAEAMAHRDILRSLADLPNIKLGDMVTMPLEVALEIARG